MVAVISPAQLSFAVGAVAVTEHSPVKAGNSEMAGTGAVMSSTNTVCNWVVVLPLPSL